MSDDITCPDCSGKGIVHGFACGGANPGYRDDMKCFTCRGTGKVDAEYPARLAEGRRMRKERVARVESLYDAAKRLGMTSSQLSGIENGRKK